MSSPIPSPYCHKLWEATQPYLAEGDVQVRHVMVAVIAPQSAGRAAALLNAPDPQAAMAKHEQAFGHSPVQPLKDVPAAAARRIEANNALMDSLGVSGTPATVYKDEQGNIRMAVGMLPPDRIKAIFGSSVPAGQARRGRALRPGTVTHRSGGVPVGSSPELAPASMNRPRPTEPA